jgi:hypothetical protein
MWGSDFDEYVRAPRFADPVSSGRQRADDGAGPPSSSSLPAFQAHSLRDAITIVKSRATGTKVSNCASTAEVHQLLSLTRARLADDAAAAGARVGLRMLLMLLRAADGACGLALYRQ